MLEFPGRIYVTVVKVNKISYHFCFQKGKKSVIINPILFTSSYLAQKWNQLKFYLQEKFHPKKSFSQESFYSLCNRISGENREDEKGRKYFFIYSLVFKMKKGGKEKEAILLILQSVAMSLLSAGKMNKFSVKWTPKRHKPRNVYMCFSREIPT